MCSRATLGVLNNGNISCSCQDLNPEPSIFSPVHCVFIYVLVAYLVTQSVVHCGPLTLNYQSISPKVVSERDFGSVRGTATVTREIYCGEACKLC